MAAQLCLVRLVITSIQLVLSPLDLLASMGVNSCCPRRILCTRRCVYHLMKDISCFSFDKTDAVV